MGSSRDQVGMARWPKWMVTIVPNVYKAENTCAKCDYRQTSVENANVRGVACHSCPLAWLLIGRTQNWPYSIDLNVGVSVRRKSAVGVGSISAQLLHIQGYCLHGVSGKANHAQIAQPIIPLQKGPSLNASHVRKHSPPLLKRWPMEPSLSE